MIDRPFERIICVVADGFGIGAAPDASDYGDEGSNTLGHVADRVGGLKVPVLQNLGLGHLGNFRGIPPQKNPAALVSRLAEKSIGKDTTTGHWEIAGLVTRQPFSLFPQGFPKELVDSFIREAKIPGVLGNIAASGTIIIDVLGSEHISSGKPILYTSGDSVFQIAAHERHFGLSRLYQICEVARRLTEPYKIGRVIARPFVGEGINFKRTENRRDFSLAPPPNCLDALSAQGVQVYSVGKIEDIFAHRGITHSNHTGNNPDGLRATLAYLKKSKGKQAFIFTNLVDFDQLYGHRRDPVGYARSIVEMDTFLPSLLGELGENDLFLLTADHGCDPTFNGTDHTREYVPLVAYCPRIKGKRLSDRPSFVDISATLFHAYGFKSPLPDPGTSILTPD